MSTYKDKKYLDYDGLVEVFRLLNGKFLDKVDVDSLLDAEIQKAYCTVHGCTTEEPVNDEFNGKSIDITWGGGEPVEIEEAGNLNDIRVDVDDEPQELETVEIVEKTTLHLEMSEEIAKGNIKVTIPKGTIRIVETGEVNDDEEFEYEVTLPNNEIWYKTSDNQPVSLKTTGGFGATYISNEYDESNGYCKIKFDGDVTTIPGASSFDGFMYSSKTLTDIIHLPSTITSIKNEFLNYCTNLQSIDLSSLTGVTSIGNNFLSNCESLTQIDLSSLTKVTAIGSNFLGYCSKLQSIDLSPLSGITKIANKFLCFCTNLQSIDLSPLSGITSIGYDVLKNCPNLQSIDLSSLSGVTSIGSNFLDSNKNLTQIDFSSLTSVTNIDDYFLSSCEGLTELDLSSLSGLTSIGGYFLNNCSKLQSVKLSSLIGITSIGNRFLAYCTKLQSVDLSSLTGITSINNDFLLECSSLQVIDLSPLSEVTSIGNGFLSYCRNLQTIDLLPLTSVTKIGNKFLYTCTNLQSPIDFSSLSGVTSIGSGFLGYCTKLKTFIIDVPDKVVSLPLTKSTETPDSIYVNDDLLEQYKEAVPNFADKFKLLSKYK